MFTTLFVFHCLLFWIIFFSFRSFEPQSSYHGDGGWVESKIRVWWFPKKSFHISREFGIQKIDPIVHQCIFTKPIPPKNKRTWHDCLCHLKLAKINLDALFYLFSVVLCFDCDACAMPCHAVQNSAVYISTASHSRDSHLDAISFIRQNWSRNEIRM